MKYKNALLKEIVLLLIVAAPLHFQPAFASGTDASPPAASSEWKPIPQDGVISVSGTYRLQQNLTTERTNGIDIRADNVVLDLGGHSLRYSGTPKEGTYGIVASNRNGVTITNGNVGGFWFNIHCNQNRGLRVQDVNFDDIPYLAINVAQSNDVVINGNSFVNFRYDLSKPQGGTYVIGVNIGAENAVISNNRFVAQPKADSFKDVNIETVFVLFSANVSKHCLVTQNDMMASEALRRSYGVWVGSDAEATITDNTIRNTNYGVCLADGASALVCFNRFAVSAGPSGCPAFESFGITARGAKSVVDFDNTFDGVAIASQLPMLTSPTTPQVSGAPAD